MAISAGNIFPVVETLSTHYKNNLNNRFLRGALNHLTLERGEWEMIDDLLENCDFIKVQSYNYMELYDRILACARFVDRARNEIGDHIASLSGGTRRTVGQMDRVLFDMAVSNFKSNLSIFADSVHELYLKTTEADKLDHKGRNPDFLRNPDLKNIGKMLVG